MPRVTCIPLGSLTGGGDDDVANGGERGLPEASTEVKDDLGAGIGKGILLPLVEYFVKSRSLGERGGVLRPRSRSVNDMTCVYYARVGW